MTENARNTRLNRDIPIVDHYDKAGHSLENKLFQIIHILSTHPVDGRSMPKCRKCKKYCIYQLRSLKLLGLNVFG